MNLDTLKVRVAAGLDDAISFVVDYYGVQPSVAHELPPLLMSFPSFS
jgi:hypothetical protein